ncbi:peptidase MA family metallohydrolase [Chloroflexota bacterium]
MMIKKAGIFALVVSLLLVLLCPTLVQAEAGLTISNNSAETEFPLKLNFSLSAKSDVNITDVRLHYAVDRESYAQVNSEVYVEFTPATTIDVEWAWDMRKTGGLPPGTVVEYWWTVEDAGGAKVETTPLKVHFNDKRYSWKSLTEGKVTILWYEGTQSFAQELMSTAQEALARLAEDTGAYLKKPVGIYIYADPTDLQGAMIFPQEWTGGVAFIRYSTIAIGISTNDLDWGKRATVHELTHLVTHQMTANPYNDLPNWLNEGLSMYNEGLLEAGYVNILKKAVTEDNLITVRTLSSEFSADPAQAYLAYAESYSLLEFLIGNYGRGKMLELLTTFSQGNGYYDNALEQVYGFDRDGLNTLWLGYVRSQYQEAGMTTAAISPVLIGTLDRVVSGFRLDLRLATQSWGWGWVW